MLVMSLILPSFAFAEGGNESVSDDSFALTLMHFNDSHAHVEGYPKMITAIKEIRQEDPDALLLNGGDVFSGTLYFNEFKGQADVALMNLMGLDAMVFGNHEFDLGDKEGGQKSLSEFVKNANFPLLGTNIDFSGDAYMSGLVGETKFLSNPEAGTIYDGIIKEVKGEQIGIFGLTTEDTIDIASPVNVKFSNYIDEAKRAVSYFEEQGINKIISVNHIGFDSNPNAGNDILLAKHVPGIDIIVGGHSHTKVEEPKIITEDNNGKKKDPTVIVQAFQYAEFLGNLNVEFDENGVLVLDKNGEVDGKLIELKDKADDPEALEVLAPFKEAVEELQNEKTGAFAIKTLENPRLGEGSEISVRANETELGNLVTDAMLAKAKEKFPQTAIAMQNGGGIRAAIDEGEITVGEVISVLPFGNDPVIAELTGQEIKDLLEHSVHNAPDENGGFLHLAGMKYTYDSSKEVGDRVVSMEVNINDEFVDIELDKVYTVTTNNFTGKGGDGFEVFEKAYDEGRVKDIGEIDWEQLRDYMVEEKYLNGVVDPVLEGRIIDVAEEEPTEPTDPEEPEEPTDPGDPTNPDPTPTPEEPGNGDGIDDGSKPGNDNNGDGSDQGEGNDKDQDQTPGQDHQGDNNQNQDGKELPKTATNMYSFMLFGAILLLSGGAIVVYRRIRV